SRSIRASAWYARTRRVGRAIGPTRRASKRIADGALQRRALKWLAQDREAHLRSRGNVAVAGREHDPHLRIAFAHLLGKVDAVHAVRHDDVAEQHVDCAAGLQLRERLRGVLSAQDPVPDLLQQRRRQVTHLGIVLDDEYGAFRRRRVLRANRLLAFRHGRVAAGEAQGDGRTFAQCAAHVDDAARLMDKAVNLRQAEAGTLADLLGGEERIEYLL